MSSRKVVELVDDLRYRAANIGFACHSSLFIDIPAELIEIVDALLCLSTTNETIIEKFRVSLKHSDLLRLNPGVWLNDEIINFFLKLCEEREKAASHALARNPNLFMNSFFYDKLVDHGRGFKYSNVQKWVKGVDIFSCNRVFIPINMSQHWSLVCVSIPTREILYLDSLGKDGKTVMLNITKWLQNELSFKHSGCDIHDFTEKNVRCPLQLNGDDCGIFVLTFVDLLSNDCSLDIMNQSQCYGIRKLIAFWIIRGRLVSLPFDC